MVIFKDRITAYFCTSAIIFLFATFVFGIGLIVKDSAEKYAEVSYEKARVFYRELEKEISDKAGSVITSNNMSSLVYKTVLRVATNLPYSEISKYRYMNNELLEINIDGDDDIAVIERLVRYGEVTKDGDTYLIRLF